MVLFVPRFVTRVVLVVHDCLCKTRKVISIKTQYNKVWDMLDNTEAPGLLVVPFG